MQLLGSYFMQLPFKDEATQEYWELLLRLLNQPTLTVNHLHLTNTWSSFTNDTQQIVISELKSYIDEYSPTDDRARLLLLKYGYYRTQESSRQKINVLSQCIYELDELDRDTTTYTRLYILLHNSRAVCYQHCEEHELALQDYSYALTADSKYAMAYYNRGNLHMKMNDYESAIENYNNAVEIDSNYEAAYYNRSLCLERIGYSVKALQDATIAYHLLPSENSYKYHSLRRMIISANNKVADWERKL
jgi:tetratricopeptide (TPR) repeat protein